MVFFTLGRSNYELDDSPALLGLRFRFKKLALRVHRRIVRSRVDIPEERRSKGEA